MVQKEDKEPRCFMCDRVATIKCPGCSDVWFCCWTHGRIHYREEVGQCFPWRVDTLPVVGRVMRTTRPVKAGETLFMEEPIVHGPNQVGSPICLSCYASVSLDYFCDKCGYPMCDQECATHPTHLEECKILSRGERPVFDKNGETEAYHCILPLRLLLLSRQDPERFSLSDHLMDHEEDRAGSDDWRTTERTVVDNLVVKCKAGQHEQMTVEEVRRALGVLEVNCYEVYSFIKKSASHSCGLRGCFPAASLLSHSCVANSRHIWGTEPPYTNTCIATVDMEAGTEVVTSYVHPTTALLRRRYKLKAGWYFECGCRRCQSQTELGTDHSTLVCPACGQPRLVPRQPLVLGSLWQCLDCGHEVTEQEVLVTLDKLSTGIKTIIDNNRYDANMWLQMLDMSLKIVHHHHDVVTEISKFLIPILCRGPGVKTDDFPLSLVRRKLELATWQMEVLDVIDPGYSKSRAKILYEIVETKMYLSQKDTFKEENLIELVEKCREQIDQVILIIERLKPDQGFETMILKASKNLKMILTFMIQQIHNGSFEQKEWRNESWYLLDLCSL